MLPRKTKISQNAILLRYCRKMTVISFPLEIFQRLSAQINSFYGQNIVHAVLCFEASPTTRKTQSFYYIVGNDRNFLPVGDLSTFKRPNKFFLRTDHSARCIMLRNEPKNTQNAIILRYCRQMSANSFPLDIFQRLSAQITASYGQNLVHAVLSVETSATTRRTRSFVDFDEK
jgi:hypothetical protein